MPSRRERPEFRPGGVRHVAGGILALSIATFLAITTELLPVGLLPLIGDELGISEGVTGLLVTVYAFMVAVLALPLTLLTARVPRKALLLATLVAYAASNALGALAPDFAYLAAGRALGGLAHALFFSVAIGYGARLVRPEHTGRALALITAGASAGFVLGVPLSTSLGAALGWRASFWLLAAGCTVTVLVVALLLPPVPGGGAPHGGLGRASRRTRLGVVVGVNTVVYLGQYTVYTYIAVLLLAAGLPLAGLGPALLALGALGLIGTWFAAVTLDRRPRAGTLLALVLIVVALVGLGFAFPALIGVLTATAVWSAAFGGIASMMQTAAIRTAGASPDVIGALVNASANVGIGAGAALGAAVLAWPGLEWLAFTGAALVLVGTTAAFVARESFPPLAPGAERTERAEP
ncbi:MFS transporter [Agromyces intestinalis]|uniref:MFS transporter n=1 Tax=Agromyces intestinalis TaxID=2592652 RepID=A0A5C1YF66_9MICO|nr:MFS transporter [Agromyces intestinalis]QEO14796.1 MFS transporter [Agromyces intestinalis]